MSDRQLLKSMKQPEPKQDVADILNLNAGLGTALEAHLGERRIASDIAFHVADIVGDFAPLRTLVDRACSRGALTEEEWNRLFYFFFIHWAYHLPRLRRLWRRAQVKLDAKRKRTRRCEDRRGVGRCWKEAAYARTDRAREGLT